MSEQKITVELTEATVRAHVRGECSPEHIEELDGALRAALPPEYAEGTVAWVTPATGNSLLAEWDGEWWITLRGGDGVVKSWYEPSAVSEVEPIISGDEISVKRPMVAASVIRHAAEYVESHYFLDTAEWMRSVADALEAEERHDA